MPKRGAAPSTGLAPGASVTIAVSRPCPTPTAPEEVCTGRMLLYGSLPEYPNTTLRCLRGAMIIFIVTICPKRTRISCAYVAHRDPLGYDAKRWPRERKPQLGTHLSDRELSTVISARTAGTSASCESGERRKE